MSKNIDKDYLLNESKVFCMLPWVHMHMGTNGDFKPCCVASMHYPYGTSADMTMTEAFDSDGIRKLRLAMLNDEKSPECRNCYLREEGGVVSTRQWTTERWKDDYFERVENTKDDGSINESTMPYLDLRFSNKCNLRCIMCTPSSSSSWRGDAIKLWNVSGEEVDRITGTRNIERTESEITAMLDGSLDDLEEVYFAGGEPMMMQEHWDTLNYLISIGRTDVIIRYSTNFTKLKYKDQHIFDLWKQFKDVMVSISLDGYGERGEYIRKGIRWNEIVENVTSLQELIKTNPHISYKFDCTLSIFNIYHLGEFHRQMIEDGIANARQFHIITLLGPPHLRAQVLTPSLKVDAEKRIREHIAYLDDIQKHSRDKHSLDFIIEKFEKAITFMNAEDNYEAQYDEFIKYVTKIDNIRKMDYLAVCPELERLKRDG